MAEINGPSLAEDQCGAECAPSPKFRKRQTRHWRKARRIRDGR
jgi:hypothetical protein